VAILSLRDVKILACRRSANHQRRAILAKLFLQVNLIPQSLPLVWSTALIESVASNPHWLNSETHGSLRDQSALVMTIQVSALIDHSLSRTNVQEELWRAIICAQN